MAANAGNYIRQHRVDRARWRARARLGPGDEALHERSGDGIVGGLHHQPRLSDFPRSGSYGAPALLLPCPRRRASSQQEG